MLEVCYVPHKDVTSPCVTMASATEDVSGSVSVSVLDDWGDEDMVNILFSYYKAVRKFKKKTKTTLK